MIAVIMAGGSGTRLRPLTSYRPKPMLPILNKPIMEYIIHLLIRTGIKKAVTTLYFRPNDIKDYFSDGSEWEIDLDYSLETAPLGTAGSVKLAQDKFPKDEAILIISGDALTDFDLKKAYAEHKKRKAEVSILLKKVENPLEYGVVATDEKGWIEKFLEKPGRGQVVSDLVNTGMYIIEPHILDSIPENKSFDFAKDLFPKLLKEKRKIAGIEMEGYWADIGDLKQYVQAQMDIMNGKVDLRIPGKKIADGVWIGEHVELTGEEKITPPVFIGENCRLAKDAKVGPYAVVGDNTVLEERTHIERSVIMANGFIGENAELQGTILGRNVVVEMGSMIHEGAVVSDNCNLGEHATVQAGVFIWPAKSIESEAIVTHDLVWSKTHQATIFGGNIVKGLANIRLTPQFSMHLAMAFGAVLGRKKLVVVSRDGSRASRLIKRSMTAGIMAMGVDVIDLHGMPSSMCMYAIRSFGADGGCHVRIGNEHSEILQLEFYDENGYPLGREHQRKIEALHSRGEFPRVKVDDVGSLHYRPGFVANYVEEALSCVDKDLVSDREFSIVIDYNYGSTSLVIPHLLDSLDCELISLRPYAEGGARRAIDSKTASERLVRMTRLNADLGVLMDPHGETFSIVDEIGNIHSPEIARLLLVQRMLQLSKDGVVIPVHWSDAYSKLISNQKGKMIPSKTDWGEVLRTASSEMDQPGDWVSFYHFYHEADASFALLKILELVASLRLPLSKIIADLPNVNVRSKKIICSWEKMGAVLRKFSSKYPSKKVESLDGIKVRLNGKWCLLLPDASSPKLVLTVEGESGEESDAMMIEYEKIIQDLIAKEDE